MRLPHCVDICCYLVVVASQAQESCRDIFIRIGGIIMTLFQKCLTMSNPGWAPDQPMDHIFHLSTVALFAYSFLPFQSMPSARLHLKWCSTSPQLDQALLSLFIFTFAQLDSYSYSAIFFSIDNFGLFSNS